MIFIESPHHMQTMGLLDSHLRLENIKTGKLHFYLIYTIVYLFIYLTRNSRLFCNTSSLSSLDHFGSKDTDWYYASPSHTNWEIAIGKQNEKLMTRNVEKTYSVAQLESLIII